MTSKNSKKIKDIDIKKKMEIIPENVSYSSKKMAKTIYSKLLNFSLLNLIWLVGWWSRWFSFLFSLSLGNSLQIFRPLFLYLENVCLDFKVQVYFISFFFYDNISFVFFFLCWVLFRFIHFCVFYLVSFFFKYSADLNRNYL